MLKRSKIVISASVLSACTPVLIQSGSVAKASGFIKSIVSGIKDFARFERSGPGDLVAVLLGIACTVSTIFVNRSMSKEINEMEKTRKDYLEYEKICKKLEALWTIHRGSVKEENVVEACILFKELYLEFIDYGLIRRREDRKDECKNIIENINRIEERLMKLEGGKDEDYRGGEEVAHLVPKGIKHVGFHQEIILYLRLQKEGAYMEQDNPNLLTLLREKYPRSELFRSASVKTLDLGNYYVKP